MTDARTFDSGATRDTDDRKHDYEGFLSPLVLREYARYMHQHRTQIDGKQRASDNWQKGFPLDALMKSMFRHFMDVWTLHRGYPAHDFDGDEVDIEDALCGLLFNVQAYLHELVAPTWADKGDVVMYKGEPLTDERCEQINREVFAELDARYGKCEGSDMPAEDIEDLVSFQAQGGIVTAAPEVSEGIVTQFFNQHTE